MMSPANEPAKETCTCHQSLAIASVPMQPWEKPCDPALGLKRGTIFNNLYFPFYIGGESHA